MPTSQLPRALKPFARPQYRLLAGGLVFALFSDGVWLMALVWQIIELGGGPGQVSMATAASALGIVVSTLAGGVLADRVSQRSIIISLELVKTAVFVVIGTTALLGWLTLPLMVAAALCGGMTTGMYYPAYSSLLPRIVAQRELQAANGVEGFLRPVLLQALGPMVAGAVIGIALPGLAVIVAAATSVVAALCYLAMDRLPPRDNPLRGNHVRGVVTDLAEGFGYMVRTPWLWGTLCAACFFVLMVMGPIEVLVPFALKERIDGNAGDHALVLVGFGVGAALGSLTFGAMGMPRRYLSVIFVVWGVSTLPLVAMGLAQSLWLFVLAGLVLGITFDGPMVLWGTLLQRRVPPHLLGRVASLDFFVSVALMPVSMALVAPVSHLIGVTATFVLAGLLPVPVTLACYLAARLWRDEIDHPLGDESAEPEVEAGGADDPGDHPEVAEIGG